jgi:hypothetical protein
MIRKTKQGHQVVSESGKPLSSPDLSKAEAHKRLAEVEFFKSRDKKRKKRSPVQRWADGDG